MPSIRRRGDKWQVQIRRTGFKPQSRSFLTKRDALAWARHMEVRADNGELPNHRQDIKVLQRITLGELVQRYIETVTPRKRGKDVERIVLNAFLRHPLSCKRMSELEPRDFCAYRDERLKTIKPSTLRRQIAPLHNLFEVARDEWGLPIKDNPLSNVDLFPPAPHRERRLLPGEFERLVKAAKSRKNPYVYPIMCLALETAMRRGELLGIRWEHWNRSNQSLFIPNTKNGHSRTIPLTPEATSILQRANDLSMTEERVFPLTPNAFRLAWERTKRAASIHDLRFHDLRHEAISRLFEKGLSVPEVALISGHRDPRMLFRYTHPLAASIQKKLN